MRDQLKSYVDLLFAGATDADDIKQEILQNTLDRYDDLTAHGKAPEAAYRLAISGIGDIGEILGTTTSDGTDSHKFNTAIANSVKPMWKRVLAAIGICLYIICPIPLFILHNELGLCGLLAIVAAATAFMVISGGKYSKQEQNNAAQDVKSESELTKAVNSIIWAVGLCSYFILSFTSKAWYITWIIFPLIGAVQGLVKACLDLKEATKREN